MIRDIGVGGDHFGGISDKVDSGLNRLRFFLAQDSDYIPAQPLQRDGYVGPCAELLGLLLPHVADSYVNPDDITLSHYIYLYISKYKKVSVFVALYL